MKVPEIAKQYKPLVTKDCIELDTPHALAKSDVLRTICAENPGYRLVGEWETSTRWKLVFVHE